MATLLTQFVPGRMVDRHGTRQMMANIDVTRCPPCRYDGFNQIIEEAFMQDGLHSNFI